MLRDFNVYQPLYTGISTSPIPDERGLNYLGERNDWIKEHNIETDFTELGYAHILLR